MRPSDVRVGLRQSVGTLSRSRGRAAIRRRPSYSIGIERLEGRSLLAVSTWSGAVDGLWSKAGNWDVAPTAGSDLVFPAGASNLANVNDLTAGTALGSLTFGGSGYSVSGNAVSLAGSIQALNAAGQNLVSLPLSFSSAATVNVANAGVGLTLSGPSTGSSGLTKQGGGELVIASSDAFGSVTVAAGAIRVDGVLPSDTVLVNSGGTLGGGGVVGSILANGGTVQPGRPGLPAFLTVNGAANFSSSSTYAVALNGTSQGFDYSTLGVGGSVALNSATLNATLGFTPVGNTSFTILNNNGSGPIAGSFAGLPEGSTFAIGGEQFKISYVGGTGNDVVLTHLAPTTTSLAAAPTTAVFGQPVTFTATVAGSGSVIPTGAVQFFNGSVSLGTAPISGGQAILTTQALPIGTQSVSAKYLGDGGSTPSESSPLTVAVTKAATASAVTAVPNPAPLGFPVLLTVTVAPVLPGAGTPTGTVEFFNGAASLGTAALNNGVAQLSDSSLALGNHAITAVFAGDGNFTASTSPPVTLSVSITATNTALSVTPKLAVLGEPVTLQATVSGTGTPTGNVEFFDGATSLGVQPISGGQATLVVSNLGLGSHTFTARYLGNAGHDPSTSLPVPSVVTAISTTTVVTAAPTPSVFGQSVSLTATVSAVSPGTGTPTGTVEFLNGTASLGTVALSGGVATLPTDDLPVGTSAITATYSGSTDFLTSTSTPYSQTVNQAATTTGLTSAPNPSAFGESVTLTATVSAAAPGGGTPTGTVTFLDDGTTLATRTLVNGVASLVVSELPTGANSLTARYEGSTSYATSLSAPVNQQVTQSQSTTTVTASTLTPLPFQPVTLTAKVAAADLGAASLTGSVEFFANGVSLGKAEVDGNGQALLTTTKLPVSIDAVTAKYLGDENTGPSTSAPLTLTVGSPNQRYVEQLYQQLFKVPADTQGLLSWSGLLDEGMSRKALVAHLAAAPLARTQALQSFFKDYLGRYAVGHELGKTAQAAEDQQINERAVILGTHEYYQQAGGTIEGYLDALALDLLGAPFSTRAQQVLAGQLRDGTTRTDVAEEVLVSIPGRQALVQQTFHEVFDRNATESEAARNVKRLGAGVLLREINLALLASEGFYNLAAYGSEAGPTIE